MHLRSPGGGFRNNSPSKINQKKLSIHQTLFAKKNAKDNNKIMEKLDTLQIHKTQSVDIQIDKNFQENTIEEKMVEETFGSRDFGKKVYDLQTSAKVQIEASNDLMNGSAISSETRVKMD